MARTDTLPNFLTDVADAIREKKGSSDTILASDFDTEIENLPSGGGADLSEYFNNTINENITNYGFTLDYVKKVADLIIGDNVTQLSYIFNDYHTLGYQNGKVFPRVVCNSNITDMSYMYAKNSTDSQYMTEIDLSGLNTSNVTNMGYMFLNRGALTNLDLSNFNFSKVTKVTHMFERCDDLLYLDLSNFRGESLGDIFALNSVFYNCNKITKIDLSNLNPTERVDARSMFYYCYKLEEIYLDSWDLANTLGTGQNGMFTNCGSQLENEAVTKVYVKDADAQNWILTANNGHPTTWTTANVIIAGSAEDLRNA